MDLKISFADKELITRVYVKMDAPDQLLLFQGVCRQLGVVCYHRDVHPMPANSKRVAKERVAEVESFVESSASPPKTGVTSSTGSEQTSATQVVQGEELTEGESGAEKTVERHEKSSRTVMADPPIETTWQATTTVAIPETQTPPEVTPGNQEMVDGCQQKPVSTSLELRSAGTQTDASLSNGKSLVTTNVHWQAGSLPVTTPITSHAESRRREAAEETTGLELESRPAVFLTPSTVVSEKSRRDKSADSNLERSLDPQVSISPVRVKLISSVKLPQHKSTVVQVEAPGTVGAVLLEAIPREMNSLEVGESLLDFTEGGIAKLAVANCSCFTRVVHKGTVVGTVSEVTVIDSPTLQEEALKSALLLTDRTDVPDVLLENSSASVQEVVAQSGETPCQGQRQDWETEKTQYPAGASTHSRTTAEPLMSNPHSSTSRVEMVRKIEDLSAERVQWRKDKLTEILGLKNESELQGLGEMQRQYHHAFPLEEDERGETDLVQFSIDTGDAHPLRQPPRRVPFAAREEVSMQVSTMLRTGVIQPSRSPVVLVCKKDGSLRFCVDYRALNAVTKPDLFPLPQIDDLLDQLGLASGYWQIGVEPEFREKTAFIMSHGLFELRVMPFGLTNVLAVFQRLMQQVLSGLNPMEGPDFVAVYLDNVLVFSEKMDDHLTHFSRVVERIAEAVLKLKPVKCQFTRQEVDYLGHIITPDGLLPSPKHVEAVRDLAVLTSKEPIRCCVPGFLLEIPISLCGSGPEVREHSQVAG